jgi:hypothetical protein
MPMRTNCRYYESRTYANGDTVRKCDLDLAPEAPWRCPEHCPKYTPRSVDLGWDPGTLGVRDFAKEPTSLGEDDSIAALLDAAEEIVNEAGPRVLADVEADRAAQRGFIGRIKRRFGRSR